MWSALASQMICNFFFFSLDNYPSYPPSTLIWKRTPMSATPLFFQAESRSMPASRGYVKLNERNGKISDLSVGRSSRSLEAALLWASITRWAADSGFLLALWSVDCHLVPIICYLLTDGECAVHCWKRRGRVIRAREREHGANQTLPTLGPSSSLRGFLFIPRYKPRAESVHGNENGP